MKFAVSEERMIKYRVPGTAFLHLRLMFPCLMKNKFLKRNKRQGKLSCNCHVDIGGELIIMHLFQPALSAPLPAKDHCLNHHPSQAVPLCSCTSPLCPSSLISSHRSFFHSLCAFLSAALLVRTFLPGFWISLCSV